MINSLVVRATPQSITWPTCMIIISLWQLPWNLNAQQSIKLFSSIHHLEQYASTLPEFPTNDTGDWNNQSFFSLYKKRRPKWFFGFSKSDLSITALQKLLQSVVSHQEQNGYENSSAVVINPQGITLQCIIITDLNGAFHALVRYLKYVYLHKIIDENFSII